MSRAVDISIITPVLNGIKHIESCIQNVIDQDCATCEHVIVDGGSTDGTMEIIRKYASRYGHIRAIQDKGKGQSHAMNRGIEIAYGDLISFLNVDDYYEPGVLQRVLRRAKGMARPLFLVGNCNVWSGRGTLTYVNKPRHLKVEQLVLGFDLVQHPVNPSAYFYSRSIHRSVGGYNEENDYTMDLEFVLQAARKFKLRYVNEVWGNYRLHEDTKTFKEIAEGKSAQRNGNLREGVLRELSVWRRLRVTINRVYFTALKRIRYYEAPMKHYIRSPHEIGGLLQRKLTRLL